MQKQQSQNDPANEPPLRIFQAALSLICPGLGQLTQKRYGKFFIHFAIYIVSIIYPVLFLLDHCDGRSYHAHFGQDEWLVLLFSCIAPFGIIVFSVVDAMTWNPDESSRSYGREGWLAFYTAFCFFLMGLFVPYSPPPRAAGEKMKCMNHMKNISLALLSYEARHGAFPPPFTVDENGTPLHSWRVLVLPYLEENSLYDKIRLNEPWNSEHNRQFHNERILVFQCQERVYSRMLHRVHPDLKSDENCFYSVVVGEETVFPEMKTVSLDDITDGPDKTVLLVERMTPVCWMDPNHEISFDTACEGINRTPHGCGSSHVGGAIIARCDGSIYYISDTIESDRWKAALTIAGGEENMTIE